jgi:Surp module
VARNGPEFEARIKANELGNPKFNFLGAGDPYHAYYEHKVNEFIQGKRKADSTSAPLNVVIFYHCSNRGSRWHSEITTGICPAKATGNFEAGGAAVHSERAASRI